VRRDVVARYGPRLLAVLDTVSAHLITGSLRALDARVELRGQDPRLAAGSWLRTQGLASMGGVTARSALDTQVAHVKLGVNDAVSMAGGGKRSTPWRD
jgi:hypothetical protein